MRFMARARKGGLIQTKLGFLLYGKQGTWKSSLCLDFARMKREDGKPLRVLYIDAEAGSVDTYIDDLVEEGIDPDNIYLIYTQSLKEVNDYIRKVSNNEDLYELDDDGNETDEVIMDADGEPFRADAIVVDGVTVLYIATQQGLTEFSKKRAKVRAVKNELTGEEKQVAIEGAGLEIKDYNTIKFDGQNFVLSLLASGKHFAITSRESDEKVKKETSEKGKFETVATGNKLPDGFKDLAYNVKTVLHMVEDDMGNIFANVEGKDRTKVHARGELIENPRLLDWEAVIRKNKDREQYILSNDLNKAVKTEKERYEKEIDDFGNEQELSSKSSEGKSIADYHEEIKSIVDALPPTKKKALKPKLESVGLTVKYETITDVSELEKFLSIVNQ
jgi:hypothetical protein